MFDAAMQLFAQRSFDAVRIEEICDAAGIAKATFFLHFASKAALIEQFNAQLVDRLQSDLAAAPDTANSAEQRLRLFVRLLVDEYEANAGVMRQMAREFVNQTDLVSAAESANREVVDVVESIIADGQASGEFAAINDPSLAATALISTWGAFTVRWSGPGTQVDIAKLHDDLLNLILGGLRPRTQ
ncbi:TetR/AcrR family transcriptional regulator [Pyruvatibacter sp.]|uniref:TetR/AcrR family transcriptional regulator n=1 Tax=unclassified Pyruvatibacter TaxID=2618840 RepID=UPI002967C7EB|nr:TetR/AcrR family transcriptional regulator [Alphaproteobacteria bacterium]